MDQSFPATQENAAFRAVLHPYRSLGPKGFLVLMTFFGVASFIAGIVFLSIGAWPVFGFFGLDVLLVYIAFKLNYRSGRAYEIVELTPELLKVTRVDAAGKQESFDFNPYWVRVRLSERPDGRTRLRLGSHGRELEFARFLNDEERRDFARALAGALAVARGARA
ncbi:MAG TPA: DUF2244 domain-containing protein [Hyphomicrobiaceae bacterium]|nr:DUF2244 domain-containing protein [Hyphomicrobiaceae bacterium]